MDRQKWPRDRDSEHYGSFWTDRLRYTSDSDDSNFAAGSPDEPFYVVWIACENRGFLPKGCCHHHGVNDIRRLVMPSNRPASWASVSPRGTTTHPVKKRRSWACFGDRLT